MFYCTQISVLHRQGSNAVNTGQVAHAPHTDATCTGKELMISGEFMGNCMETSIAWQYMRVSWELSWHPDAAQVRSDLACLSAQGRRWPHMRTAQRPLHQSRAKGCRFMLPPVPCALGALEQLAGPVAGMPAAAHVFAGRALLRRHETA